MTAQLTDHYDQAFLQEYEEYVLAGLIDIILFSRFDDKAVSWFAHHAPERDAEALARHAIETNYLQLGPASKEDAATLAQDISDDLLLALHESGQIQRTVEDRNFDAVEYEIVPANSHLIPALSYPTEKLVWRYEDNEHSSISAEDIVASYLDPEKNPL